MTISRYRSAWLALYVLSNFFAGYVFWVTGELDGDLIGYEVPSDAVLFMAVVFVVLSYLFWMGPLFSLYNRIHVKSFLTYQNSTDRPWDWRFMALLVLSAQLGYLLYSLAFGVNVAGSKAVSDSSLRYLFYFFVPDWLFIVYYGIYRKTPGFAPNLTVYLLSNLIRGWFGMWLTVLFLEGAYRVLERRLHLRKLLLALLFGVVFVPFLHELKLAIRRGGDSSFGLLDLVAEVVRGVGEVGWLQAFGDAIWPILMRFQHLANVVGIIDKSAELSRDAGGEFIIFFSEGTPQYVMRKLIGNTELSDIHLTLLHYLIPEQLPVDSITNTHVGLVGWFWIAPMLAGIYVLYVLILPWCSVWLAKKAGGTPLLINTVWFIWLTLIMNGWFAAYIDFLQALVVIILARWLLSGMGRRLSFVPQRTT